MNTILLCGNDKEMIDDFFCHEEQSAAVTFISTSENLEDIHRHLAKFAPAVFVLCVKMPTEEFLIKIDASLTMISESGAKFALVTADSELDALYERFFSVVQFTYPNSLGVKSIIEKLADIEAIGGNVTFGKVSENLSASKAQNEPKMIPPSNIKVVSEPRKILIVDDDVNMLRTLKLDLQDEYSVAVASSGQIALKYLQDKTVDLILLDYMMPGMDGQTVLSHIRNSFATCKIPVIFLTGVSDRDKIKQIISSNVQGYLLKPVENAKLHDAIKKALKI